MHSGVKLVLFIVINSWMYHTS